MASFLVVGNNDNRIEEFIRNFIKKNKVSKFDQNRYIQDIKPANKAESTVKLLKKIKDEAYFKPVESDSRLTIIYKVDELSIPAQNSLLKIIEEPPNFLNIILTTGNINKVLETIKSRCFIEYLDDKNEEFSDEDIQELLILIDARDTDYMKLSEDIALDKEPRKKLNLLIYYLRKQMLEAIENNNIEEAIRLKAIISKLNKSQITLNNRSINTRNTIDFLLLDEANT